LEALLHRFFLAEHVGHQADHQGLIEGREVGVLLIILINIILKILSMAFYLYVGA
jgi:hypothetical protein